MVTDSEAAVARAVLLHGPISRSALTSRLGLSPASLTRLAKPLLDGGILIELDEDADGSVGRPSRPLDISPAAGTFIGIKLTGDRLHLATTSIRAEERMIIERPLSGTAPADVVGDIVEAITSLGVDDLRGIGVSLGGLVRDGVALHAPFLGWNDVDLAAPLATWLGVPVTVENDLVSLAEAERWFGLGRSIPGFAIITIGAGVGYGLVVDGRAVRTADAGTGTGGHIPLSPYGPLCSAGHRGCAQAMLTIGSIVTQVSGALQRAVSYDEVLQLAADREPAARAVVEASGEALGRLIALAANLTLQPAVILAGEGIALYDLAHDQVHAAIAAGRDPRAEHVTVQLDRTGFSAWARGAAAVAIQTAMGRISLHE